MKHLIYILVATFILVSCKDAQKKDPQTVEIKVPQENKELLADASHAKAEFSIEGMTCAVGCAARIEKNLGSKEGVSYAKVDFDKKLAMVAYDKDALSFDDLNAAVSEVSDIYTVADMKNVSEFGTDSATDKKSCDEDCKKECCAKKSEAEKKECAKDCDKPCCAEKKAS